MIMFDYFLLLSFALIDVDILDYKNSKRAKDLRLHHYKLHQFTSRTIQGFIN